MCQHAMKARRSNTTYEAAPFYGKTPGRDKRSCGIRVRISSDTRDDDLRMPIGIGYEIAEAVRPGFDAGAPDMSFFTRSDNITFARRGVVAHTVSSYGLHKEYHTPADETKGVDYAHMTEAIASMIDPLAWLANTKFRPSWKPGMKP